MKLAWAPGFSPESVPCYLSPALLLLHHALQHQANCSLQHKHVCSAGKEWMRWPNLTAAGNCAPAAPCHRSGINA